MKFNDYTPNDDDEACLIILKYFSSPKKIISQNYTKNNFAIFKKCYPKFWEYIANKTFCINNKQISFKPRTQFTLIINGQKFIKQYSNDRKIWEKFKHIIFPLDDGNIDNRKHMLSNIISLNPAGFDVLNFVKKFYPNLYNTYLILFLDSKSHREVIYRAIHGIYDIPNINGVKLKFLTYNSGYESKNIYEALKNVDISDEDAILNVFVNKLKNEKKASIHLKRFFPKLYEKIDKKYSCKFFSTKVMLYLYKLTEMPKCAECGKPINEKNTYKFYEYCSLKCARQHFSKETAYLAEKLYGKNWMIEWENYKDLSNKFTSISYNLYKDIINPSNLLRSKTDFHLDHIIPKSYGFLNKIDPKIISHYKNLQMLSAHDNLVKSTNISNIDEINELIFNIKDNLQSNNYFKIQD